MLLIIVVYCTKGIISHHHNYLNWLSISEMATAINNHYVYTNESIYYLPDIFPWTIINNNSYKEVLKMFKGK